MTERSNSEGSEDGPTGSAIAPLTLTYVSTADTLVASPVAVRALMECRSGMLVGATILWIGIGLWVLFACLVLFDVSMRGTTIIIVPCTIPAGIAAFCLGRCARHLGRLTTRDRAVHLERVFNLLKLFWITCAILPMVLIACVFVAFQLG